MNYTGGSSGKEHASVGDIHGFDLWAEKIPWKRAWQPIPVPGESHGQRSLVGYNSWGQRVGDLAHT